MATSSDQVSSDNSLSKGCDEVPYCTKCQITTDLIEAEKFCVECSEYICTKCHSDHDKWSANKSHTIVKASEGIQFFGQKLSEMCHLHKGLLIDMYCHSHDDVCCSTCAVSQHRSCHTESILQLSKGIKESNEYTAVFTTAEEILKKLAKSKAKEELIGLSVNKDLSSDITKVKEGRALIKIHFDKVEERSVSLLSAVHEEKQKRAGQNIEIVDRLISSITDIRDGLTSKNVESDAAIFVKIKRGNIINNETQASLAELTDQRVRDSSSVFEFDPTIVDKTRDLTSFGKLLHINRVYRATLLGDFNVHHASDSTECGITDSALIDDGSLLIIDRLNNKLKKLDTYNSLVDYCEIPGKPYGICKIENTKSVAVSVFEAQKIQFVSVNSAKMTLASSFYVRAPCRGIAYKDGELFVSCGGLKKEGPGHIAVYDICGTLLRSIGQGSVAIPIHIAFSSHPKYKDTLYVTDSGRCAVVHLKITGDFINNVKVSGIADTKGICVVDSSHIFISGKHANNVVQFDEMNGDITALVGKETGVFQPCSLLYDRATSRLVVTMYRNNIKVFAVTSNRK